MGDYTVSTLTTAPKFVTPACKTRAVVEELCSDDDYTSDDEFESLTQQR